MRANLLFTKLLSVNSVVHQASTANGSARSDDKRTLNPPAV